MDAKTVVSVGYFLRYLKGEFSPSSSSLIRERRGELNANHFFTFFWGVVVQKMRSIIEENDLHVMATVARYVCSYVKIEKQSWWMKSKDCGPIVEQATHFIDLSRYFGGDVDLSTVQAHSLGEFFD